MGHRYRHTTRNHHTKLQFHQKLLDTQLRIHHRFYHTQAQLHKWGISAEPNCPSCDSEDNLIHHFLLCDKETFWQKLRAWKKNILNIDINETYLDILIGIPNENNEKCIDFINFVNLCAKNYIRESENKSVYLNVFLVRLKEWCVSIKNKDLREMFYNSF